MAFSRRFQGIYREMRGYKHDFHHHLQTLKGQLEAGETKRALAYLEQELSFFGGFRTGGIEHGEIEHLSLHSQEEPQEALALGAHRIPDRTIPPAPGGSPGHLPGDARLQA